MLSIIGLRLHLGAILLGLAAVGFGLQGVPRAWGQPQDTPPKGRTPPEVPPPPTPPQPMFGDIPAPFFNTEGPGRRERLRRLRQGLPVEREKVRFFNLPEETYLALVEDGLLEALPGLRHTWVGDRLVVAGPAALVDATPQLLAGWDPELLPPRLTVQVRVYLGSDQPTPVKPPPEDAFIPRLQEQFGFPHITLLAAPTWQGVDGHPLSATVEGTHNVQGGGTMKLEFSALPQIWDPQQVVLTVKTRVRLKDVVLTQESDYALETTVRGPPGETFFVTASDNLTHSTVIYAVTVDLSE